MTSRSVLLAALLFLVPSLGSAQSPERAPRELAAPRAARFQDHDLHLGLGSGWGLPIGNAESGVGLNELVVGQVPLALDVSFRALPRVFVGAYVGWGLGVPQDCPRGASCRAKDVRFGLDGRYLFQSRSGRSQRAIPWIGLGAGFESLDTRVEAVQTLKRSYQGITFVDLELGLDVPVARDVAIGPLLSLSAGEFTRATVDGTDTVDVEVEIARARMHGWTLFGARVVFGR